MSAERDALLALMLTPGLGPTLVARCLATFGSAAATADASAQLLAAIQGISTRKANDIRRGIDTVRSEGQVQQELGMADQHGVRLISRDDPDYPPLLGHIPDPPPLLWVRGELKEDDALALAIVGSRKCSLYGREQAERFAAGGARSGLCIISGGAYGIDAAAHRGAVKVGGRTIAVVGSGLADPYPHDHARLFDEIVEGGRGAIISELPMRIAPKPENFPRRNRIISGMSLGVLVVEAALRSGALITARLAVEEHHRELMAVPGRVDNPMAAGCHKVLREGWATLVTSPGDVLDCLGEAGRMLQVAQENRAAVGGGDIGNALTGTAGSIPAGGGVSGGGGDGPSLFTLNLSDSQQKLWQALGSPRSLDQLTAITGLPVHIVQSDLTMLEIRGSVKRQGGLFVRRPSKG